MTRTLVLGLDGATFRVINPLIEAGVLPNLASLRRDGASGVLESVMPPVTGPAWLSLATGLSPGTTGVYDFIRRDPESDWYDFTYVDSSAYQGRAVWDYLGEAGVPVGVVDYPTLSPPYEVNGFMLTGGLGSSETRAYPAALQDGLDDLPDVAPHLDIGDDRYRDLDVFADEVGANLSARASRLLTVLERREWEFCWAVLQEPDWVQHLLWKCFDESHPEADGVTEAKRQLFVDFWREVDDIVGRCRETIGEDANLVVQSDHGFGPMYNRSFYLNTWLRDEGYLSTATGGTANVRLKKGLWNAMSAVASALDLRNRAPGLFRWGKNEFSSMGIGLGSLDLDKSVAFDPGHIQSMGGLYVNDTLVMDPSERDRIRDEIRRELDAFGAERDLPLETYTPEEVYGTATPESPDLIVRIDGVNVENDGWDKPVVHDKPERLSHQNGSHRRDGVLIAAGPDFESKTVEGATVCDLTPTLLYLFDRPVPDAMDGSVLTDAVTADRDVTIAQSTDSEREDAALNDEEQRAMHDQLSDLGYFE